MNYIKCSKCNTNTLLTSETDFIKEEREKCNHYMLLFCESCNETFSYDPTIDTSPQLNSEELVWRCPVSGCHGFVSYIEDGENNFYGCGETGDIWKDKSNFFKEIEGIIQLYPYRKKSYLKKNNEWLPSDKEPKNINDLIDKEKEDSFEGYERG